MMLQQVQPVSMYAARNGLVPLYFTIPTFTLRWLKDRGEIIVQSLGLELSSFQTLRTAGIGKFETINTLVIRLGSFRQSNRS